MSARSHGLTSANSSPPLGQIRRIESCRSLAEKDFGKARQLLKGIQAKPAAEVNMTLNRGIALLTHPHPRLLFRGPEFDARAALRAAIATLRQAMCGLGGHEYYVHSADNRMFLECVTCGHETPGWRIDVKTRPDRIARGADRTANRALREVRRGRLVRYDRVKQPVEHANG